METFKKFLSVIQSSLHKATKKWSLLAFKNKNLIKTLYFHRYTWRMSLLFFKTFLQFYFFMATILTSIDAFDRNSVSIDKTNILHQIGQATKSMSKEGCTAVMVQQLDEDFSGTVLFTLWIPNIITNEWPLSPFTFLKGPTGWPFIDSRTIQGSLIHKCKSRP